MVVAKENLYFLIVTCLSRIVGVALFGSLFIILSPTHPLRGGDLHWFEMADFKSKDDYELFKIYSLLRYQSPDINNNSAWAISQTILEESRKHSVDPMLVLAVIHVESSFRPQAVSIYGARGLMQIRPFVAHYLTEKGALENWEGEKSLDDPIVNIKLGVFYLRQLKKSFRDLKLALTAYNWGPTTIRNRLEEDEAVPQEYAMKVLSAYRNYRKQTRPTH